MKTVDEVKDYLCEHGYEDTIVFENPGFPEAFIGVSEDGRAVYDFEKMCESLMDEWGGQNTLMLWSLSNTTPSVPSRT